MIQNKWIYNVSADYNNMLPNLPQIGEEENWKDMWVEWQDKRNKPHASPELLDQKCESYIEMMC
jgi:hypothetical protein